MNIIFIFVIMFGISEGRMALVGGANYSTIEGIEEQMSEAVTLEYLPGFRLGIENTGKGLLAGLTYSQRGFQMSTEVDSVSSTGKVFFNYITGYALARIKLSSTLNLLLGPEIGYFMEGILTVESNGEEVESESIDRDEWIDDGGNELDYGLVFGARFEITPYLHAVGTYYYGFVNITDELNVDEMKHRGFQFYLTYGL